MQPLPCRRRLDASNGSRRMPCRSLGGWALLAMSVCMEPAAGALLVRGSAVTSPVAAGRQDHGTAARQPLRTASALEVASQAITNSSTAADVDRSHRMEGLMDITQDLTASKTKDDVSLKKLETQIVELVRARDALKRDEARKTRELAFLHTEMRRTRGTAHDSAGQATDVARGTAEDTAQASTASSAAASTAGQATESTATEAEADAAIASAEQVVAQESATAAVKADASSGSSTAGTSGASAGSSGEAVQAVSAQAVATKAKTEAEMEAEAEARMRAEAEAAARKKIEAEKKVAEERQRREEEAKQAEQRAQQEKQEAEKRKMADSAADSADDSFKQFMKEEDGEDQMGDTDYEDSANALAGAIGWNRHEIESKADSAVKQLTEAIGGKKSIQAVQGMMAGIR
mmetsp:Transcript_149123/g.277936  ORF Transcript_149123/g.277936 Transcript_149123/m.277936 type:complete len:405 (+) Transcript_149123:134-1348(+)